MTNIRRKGTTGENLDWRLATPEERMREQFAGDPALPYVSSPDIQARIIKETDPGCAYDATGMLGTLTLSETVEPPYSLDLEQEALRV